jgi:predicted membrane protein
MKGSKIFWGLGLILVAVILIMDALGMNLPLPEAAGEISTFKLICGGLLAVFALASLVQGEFFGTFLSAALFVVLLEDNIAMLCGRAGEDLINNWILFVVAFLLAAGFRMLFPKRTRQKSGINVRIDDESSSNSFGNSTVYVDSATVMPADIENNLGACSVYFENPESYSGNGVLHIENNLGAMTIHVPETWDVQVLVENNLGSVKTPDETHDELPILTIKGENNLGSMTVKYVKA